MNALKVEPTVMPMLIAWTLFSASPAHVIVASWGMESPVMVGITILGVHVQ
jgi:hypothetical protein